MNTGIKQCGKKIDAESHFTIIRLLDSIYLLSRSN
jgi:hypothetical protein